MILHHTGFGDDLSPCNSGTEPKHALGNKSQVQVRLSSDTDVRFS